MSKEEYLRALARELRRLPKEEYEKAIDYYEEFFEDAGEEQIEEVIADLGTPKEVAAQITRDAAMKRMEQPDVSVKKGFSTIWVIILAVCAAPIALPVAIALLALLAAAVITAVCCLASSLILVAGCFAGGVISIVCSIFLMAADFASGLACMGIGLAITGASILVGWMFCWFFKWIIRGIRALIRRIVGRRKKI